MNRTTTFETGSVGATTEPDPDRDGPGGAALPRAARAVSSARLGLVGLVAAASITALLVAGRHVGPAFARGLYDLLGASEPPPVFVITLVALGAMLAGLALGGLGRLAAGPTGELVAWAALLPTAPTLGFVAFEQLRASYVLELQWPWSTSTNATSVILGALASEYTLEIAAGLGLVLAVCGVLLARLRGRRIDVAVRRAAWALCALACALLAVGVARGVTRPDHESYAPSLPLAAQIAPATPSTDTRGASDALTLPLARGALHVRRRCTGEPASCVLYWSREATPPSIATGAWDASVHAFPPAAAVLLRRDAGHGITFAFAGDQLVGALRDQDQPATQDPDEPSWPRAYVPLSDVATSLGPPLSWLGCAAGGLALALATFALRRRRSDLVAQTLATRADWRAARYLGRGEVVYLDDGTTLDARDAAGLPAGLAAGDELVVVPSRARDGRADGSGAAPYRVGAAPAQLRIERGTVAELEKRLGARDAARHARSLGVVAVACAPLVAAALRGMVL